MTQFIQTVASLTLLVNSCLLCAGLNRNLRQSKAYNFLCGESAFIAAIAFGALAVVGVHRFPCAAVAALTFLTGSIKFAQAMWLTD